MSPRRYFILDEACPEDELSSMMGRVVLDPKAPLRQFAPIEPLNDEVRRHNPQDIIPTILPEPSLSVSRKDFLQTVASTELALSLSEYFGFHLARTKEEKLTLESQVVKRYSLKQHKQYFEELMKNKLYEADVRQLLQGSRWGKAYFVVGFLTTTGAVWSRERVRQNATGLDLKIPVLAATGVPLPALDPGVSPSYSTETKHRVEATTAAVEIFAVAYDVIKFSHAFDKNAPKYVRKEAVLGSTLRAKSHHLAMSRESDGEDEEEDEGTGEEEDDDMPARKKESHAITTVKDMVLEEVEEADAGDAAVSFASDGL